MNQNMKLSFEILDNNLKSKGSGYTYYGSGYSSTKVKLSKGMYYLGVKKYSSYDLSTQYSFLIKLDSNERRILINDIYKYDAGKGKYLTYI